jgi:hypothetical protein
MDYNIGRTMEFILHTCAADRAQVAYIGLYIYYTELKFLS